MLSVVGFRYARRWSRVVILMGWSFYVWFSYVSQIKPKVEYSFKYINFVSASPVESYVVLPPT